MTILLVSAWGMGGTIRAALNLAEHLAANGYDVEILSAYRRRETSFFGDFPPGVKVTALDDQRKGHEPRGPMRFVRRRLRKRSSIFMHPEDRVVDEFNAWTDLQLVRHLRRRRTGFLLGTRPGLNLMLPQLCPPGMACIGLEQMNLYYHQIPLRRAMKRQYPRLDRIVVLTERDRGNYGRHLAGRGTVAVIPNTARELAGPKADLSLPVVLSAGRLTPQKGFDFLIPAFAAIAPSHPDWRLRLCGNGDLKQELSEMIAAHDASGSITLEPAADMAEAMSDASIFVMASRVEGFPLILLEAMGKGMAVISFDCPTGPADIIDDHVNGLLVPPRDVDALSAAIDEMIRDEDLRRRCATAAMATAREYTMAAVGPQWEELLAEVWSERQRAGAGADR